MLLVYALYVSGNISSRMCLSILNITAAASEKQQHSKLITDSLCCIYGQIWRNSETIRSIHRSNELCALVRQTFSKQGNVLAKVHSICFQSSFYAGKKQMHANFMEPKSITIAPQLLTTKTCAVALRSNSILSTYCYPNLQA